MQLNVVALIFCFLLPMHSSERQKQALIKLSWAQSKDYFFGHNLGRTVQFLPEKGFKIALKYEI